MFHAASASSPVTDWYHYDTIYTERYMWIPQENKEGYEAGNAMTYVDKLKGRLMIYYGTADNNVHPSNAMQLIQALQTAGKSFEVQVGPDAGPLGHPSGSDDGVLHREPRLARPRVGARHRPVRPDYSHRNTLADTAVHTRNISVRTATSPTWRDQPSPCQIPLSSDTA